MGNKLYEELVVQNLVNIVRNKTNLTEKMTFEQAVAKVDTLHPANMLNGLNDGWDVMFYDENKYALAFYSIKNGHAINPPVYTCKAWQTADNGAVEFPYTPTGDIIFYANNDTYAKQLYEHFGLDAGIYKYITMRSSSGTTWDLYFHKSYSFYDNGNISIQDYCLCGVYIENVDVTDANTIVNTFLSTRTSDNLTRSTSSTTQTPSGNYLYTNYEDSRLSVAKGLYSLNA
jgi:hypothetical protein